MIPSFLVGFISNLMENPLPSFVATPETGMDLTV